MVALFFSKRKRNRASLSREGWYYLGVLAFIIVGAILREINLLIGVAGLMAGPILLSIHLARATLRKLDISRHMPKVIGVGDLLVVDLTVNNRRRRLDSWALVIEDSIERIGSSSGEKKTTAKVLLPHVPAGSTCSASYRGRLMRRGRYRIGPISASTRFPLGLVRVNIWQGAAQEFLVCPRLGRLAPDWKKRIQTEVVGAQASRRRHGLAEGDFYGLRDWRGGDSRNWIHWRTTARRGNLSVRQFERQTNQDLILLLDLWEPKKPTLRQVENVELAASFSATLLSEQCGQGSSQITFAIAGAEDYITSGAASKGFMQEAMEQLALAESTRQGNMPKLLSKVLDKKRSGVRILVVSTQAIDLQDSDRYQEIWEDPRKRFSLRDVSCLNLDEEDIETLFTIE